MSEDSKKQTAILLPQSAVTVYAHDEHTLHCVGSLRDDWRFARVTLEAVGGDIFNAIDAYKDKSSPDLLIIQTETIDDELTANLERLAHHCSEGTAAIIIGPVNDVYLYRKLIDMGVSDYLVKPIERAAIAEVIAGALIEKIGVSNSRLISFTGSKGGVGATTLASEIAHLMSQRLTQKTLVLDFSGGWSTLGVKLGFEPMTTLSQAIWAASSEDEQNIVRMIHSVNDRLDVLASGGGVMLETSISASDVEILLDFAMRKYPVVIADLSYVPPDIKKAVIARSSDVFMVSSPAIPALRLARSALNEIKELRGGNADGLSFFINKAGMDPSNEVKKADIEAAVEFPVSGIIEFLPKLFMKLEGEGKHLASEAEGQKIIDQVLYPYLKKNFSSSLQDDEKGKPKDNEGLLSGFLNKFKS